MRILLVEDEPRAAQMLAKGLREEAYAVDVVGDGKRAVYQAAITDYDAIILDVMLPLRDGLTVCREIRREGSVVPVLMLTARDEVGARIEGLDSGADDYLTKPFDFGELLARLRAVIRRGQRPLRPTKIRVGPIELDTRGRRAFRRGDALDPHGARVCAPRAPGAPRRRGRRPRLDRRARVGYALRGDVERNRCLRAAAAPQD